MNAGDGRSVSLVAGIFAAALLIAAVLHGGIYAIVGPAADTPAFVVNRFTGTVWQCAGSSCRELRVQAGMP